RLDHTLPDPAAGEPLDRRLQGREGTLMDILPHRAHAAEIGRPHLVGDRLGTVVDQEDEAEGERQKSDKSENKTDHGIAAIASGNCAPSLSLSVIAALVQRRRCGIARIAVSVGGRPLSGGSPIRYGGWSGRLVW